MFEALLMKTKLFKSLQEENETLKTQNTLLSKDFEREVRANFLLVKKENEKDQRLQKQKKVIDELTAITSFLISKPHTLLMDEQGIFVNILKKDIQEFEGGKSTVIIQSIGMPLAAIKVRAKTASPSAGVK